MAKQTKSKTVIDAQEEVVVSSEPTTDIKIETKANTKSATASLEINPDYVASINITDYQSNIKSLEFQEYFTGAPGQEPYRLLALISTLFSNELIVDLGTGKGLSALALAYNLTNQVKSFDIINLKDLHRHNSNIEFIVKPSEYFESDEFYETLMSSRLIYLDTDSLELHETIIRRLQSLNFKGTIILDDIFLTEDAKSQWNSFKSLKVCSDLTHLGHFSGTGLLEF